ncbi:MAG: peptidoglycan binding domain-containing protein, partial [Anaerolineales bacterium]
MRGNVEATQPTRVRAIATHRARSFRARPLHSDTDRAQASRSRVVWAGVIAAVFLSLPLVLLVGAYGWLRLSQTVAPGVRVGEIPVGGMRIEQAIEALDNSWNQELVMTAVDTSDAGRIWPVRPAQFGLAVDAAETAEQAYAYAREGSLPSSIWRMMTAFSNGWDLQPIVTFDPEAARVGLESLSKTTHIPAADAQLGLAAGEVTATPAQWGRQLDIDSSLALIVADPDAILLRYGFIPLVTGSLPPAVEKVAQAANEAERLLSASPTLRAYDPVIDEWLEFTPSREEASLWLQIRRDGSELSVEVDEEDVGPYIASLQTAIGEERMLDSEAAAAALLSGLRGEKVEPLRVQYLPRYYVVTPQDTLISISFKVGIPYWQWLEENPDVEARGLRVGESITIPSRDAMLELPVVEGKRIVISISEQHMWLQEEGEVILEHVISTGIPNSPTMPGIFQVKSRYVDAYASNWDLYMPHFLGIYHATPNLLNGIHGLPLLSNGVRLWENVLGNPASYG